jgi:hypothetical protein
MLKLRLFFHRPARLGTEAGAAALAEGPAPAPATLGPKNASTDCAMAPAVLACQEPETSCFKSDSSDT